MYRKPSVLRRMLPQRCVQSSICLSAGRAKIDFALLCLLHRSRLCWNIMSLMSQTTHHTTAGISQKLHWYVYCRHRDIFLFCFWTHEIECCVSIGVFHCHSSASPSSSLVWLLWSVDARADGNHGGMAFDSRHLKHCVFVCERQLILLWRRWASDTRRVVIASSKKCWISGHDHCVENKYDKKMIKFDIQYTL